jgi:hypothetical protein
MWMVSHLMSITQAEYEGILVTEWESVTNCSMYSLSSSAVVGQVIFKVPNMSLYFVDAFSILSGRYYQTRLGFNNNISRGAKEGKSVPR